MIRHRSKISERQRKAVLDVQLCAERWLHAYRAKPSTRTTRKELRSAENSLAIAVADLRQVLDAVAAEMFPGAVTDLEANEVRMSVGLPPRYQCEATEP